MSWKDIAVFQAMVTLTRTKAVRRWLLFIERLHRRWTFPHVKLTGCIGVEWELVVREKRNHR